jgi:hypothetical protein
MSWLLIALAVVVVVIIGWALILLATGVAKGRARWDDKALWAAVAIGAVVAVPSLAIMYSLGFFLFGLVPAGLDAGSYLMLLFDAAVKYAVLIIVVRRRADRRVADIIALALGVWLGFGACERLVVLAGMSGALQSPDDAALAVGGELSGAIVALDTYAMCALAMGALTIAARTAPAWRYACTAAALIVPVILRVAYQPIRWVYAWPMPPFGLEQLTILVVATIIVVILANRALAAARRLDEEAGRERRAPTRWWRTIAGGAALVAISIPLGYAMNTLFLPDGWWQIIPAILGIDLIVAALRRRAA